MENGIVKWFNDKKGYGFIIHDKGKEIFVHHSAIDGQGFHNLREGEQVHFNVEQGRKGLVATKVRRVSDAHISNSSSSFSKWLVKLANRVSRLETKINNESAQYVEKELNTCKAWLELSHKYSQQHQVEIHGYDFYLLNNVERALQNIEDKVKRKKGVSEWKRVLKITSVVLGLVADVVTHISVPLGLIVKSIKEGVKLLAEGDIRLLGSGEG